jgi:hypothetical protein
LTMDDGRWTVVYGLSSMVYGLSSIFIETYILTQATAVGIK